MMRIVIVIALENDESKRSLISDVKAEWLIVGTGKHNRKVLYDHLQVGLYGNVYVDEG